MIEYFVWMKRFFFTKYLALICLLKQNVHQYSEILIFCYSWVEVLVTGDVWNCYSSTTAPSPSPASWSSVGVRINCHPTYSPTVAVSSARNYGNSQLIAFEPIIIQPSTFHLVWYPVSFWYRYFVKPLEGKGPVYWFLKLPFLEAVRWIFYFQLKREETTNQCLIFAITVKIQHACSWRQVRIRICYCIMIGVKSLLFCQTDNIRMPESVYFSVAF